MPSILRYILISKILKYGKLCSLELMKDDNGLIAFATLHPIWGGLITLTSSPTHSSPTIRLLLFSIQVMALAGYVITS